MTKVKASCGVVREEDLDQLASALTIRGYQLVGPVLRDSGISFDRIEDFRSLPTGWGQDQDGGRYRVKRRDDDALFSFTPGPAGLRQFLYPPEETLVQITKACSRFMVDTDHAEQPRYAFIGVRACDHAALELQDRVLAREPTADRLKSEADTGWGTTCSSVLRG